MAVESTITQYSYFPGDARLPEALAGLVFLSPDDLVVESWTPAATAGTLLVRDVHYVITGDGSTGHGVIRALGSWSAQIFWKVRRQTVLLQRTRLPSHQPLPAQNVERSLDRQMMIAQEHGVAIDDFGGRGVFAPLGEGGFVLPPRVGRAGRFLAFDAAGDPSLTEGFGADGALRADIAKPATGKGAALVAYSRDVPGGIGTVAGSLSGRGIYVSDAPFGARLDGFTDDAAAVTAAAVSGNVVMAGPGTLRCDGAVPARMKFIGLGTYLSGISRVNAGVPQYGGAVNVHVSTGENGIVGSVRNNNPPGTIAFPTGVTGHGRNDHNGNTAFGLFGRADQYATAGVVTNEVNTFNWTNTDSSSALPPDRSFGTAQNVLVGLTVAAGGIAPSSIGIQIGQEGESPQKFKTGFYVAPNDLIEYGVFLDADGSSSYSPLVVKSNSAKTAITMLMAGDAQPSNAAVSLQDTSGAYTFIIRNGGSLAVGGHVLPTVDNSIDVGSASLRIRNLFAATGAVNPSDVRLKAWKGAPSVAEIRAATRIIDELGFYQWNEAIAEKGDAARWHFGVRAQHAFAILEDEGLDWRKYAWCCFDEWDAKEAVLVDEIETVEAERKFPKTIMVSDPLGGVMPTTILVDRMVKVPQPTGKKLVAEPAREAGSLYGVRPDQLALFLIAALGAGLKACLSEFDELASRVTALEGAA